MKRLIFLVLFFYLNVNSQNKSSLDIDCFLIGLMNDYNGRTIALDYEKSSSFLASFELNERNHSKIFLDSVSKYYHISKNEIFEENGAFYNKKLAKHFNEYYIAEIDSGMGEEHNDKLYYVYQLHLDVKKFDTIEKKLSFLTGLIYSDGSFENDEVVINKANSRVFYNAVEFVKELGFTYIESYSPEYNLPTGQILRFKPSEKYMLYFKKLQNKI